MPFTENFADSSENVYVNVAGSKVTFSNRTQTGRQYFYIKNTSELSGSAWFGMKVQMSSTDLSNKPWIGLLIYEQGDNAGSPWNFVQVKGKARLR